ncbi:nSTAND1 domain-containing NTPase, partial [Microseira wollei]|uniref:nSTAND1 domain-containing NTPase n=1 Tax=Microseira wollei TaxID=467598 RepID=UPI001CFE96D8
MTRYALVIGIAQYDSSLGSLTKPTNDAEAVASILAQPGYGDWQVKRLPEGWNSEKNCYEVARERLNGTDLGQMLQDFIRQQADRKDALIYFSGHGFTVSDNLGKKKGYLATSDCTSNAIATRGIALDSLNQLILESNLSSLVVLLDCCHAGSILESNLVRQSLTAFNSSQKDYYLIAACRDFESAWEGEKYSVFTEALLKGLGEENAGSDGQVSCDRIFDFIARELKRSGQEPIRMGWGRSITLLQYPFKVAPRPTVVSETCPYQGLRYFDDKTAQFFFGRNKVVEILIQKLEQAAFVPVIGTSGSGKSSVVRAGLIPWLKQNPNWQVLPPMIPNFDPLNRLKRVFDSLFDSEPEILEQVYDAIDNNVEGLEAVLSQLPSTEQFLLVVDQFEEVFTLCRKEKERERFIELLTQIAEIRPSRLAVVMTMRADFVGDCLKYKSLTQLIQQQAVYMPPFTEEDLKEIVVKPAQIQGYSLEPGLLEAILADVLKEPESLPLLEFTLTQLWQPATEQGHQLSLAQYRELGRVSGALNRHSEQIYQQIGEKFGAPGQEWVKRICLSLVRTGAGTKDTRQRQPKADLLAIAKDNEGQIAKVLDQLVKGRLLVTGAEDRGSTRVGAVPPCPPQQVSTEVGAVPPCPPQQVSKEVGAVPPCPPQQQGREEIKAVAWVDLAHEALIEGWQQFAKWREEDRDLRRLIDRLNDARKEWSKRGQEDNYLIMGGLLAEVRQNWEKIEPYLLNAAKAFYQQSDAREQDRIAKLQQLLTESRLREQAARVLNLLTVQPLDGLVLAIKTMGENAEKLSNQILAPVQTSLHRAMETVRESILFQGHEHSVNSVAFSPNGEMIVSGSTDKTVRLWDLSGNPIGQPFFGHEYSVNSVAFSPNGEMIVSGSADKTVRLWDLSGNPIGQPFFGHESSVNSVAFSPNGEMIVSGSADKTVRLWDLSGNPIGQPFFGHES